MSTDYTIIDALKDIGRGDIRTVDRSTQQKRINICFNCDMYGSFLRQCKACHCLVDGKTWLEKSTCPRGKW